MLSRQAPSLALRTLRAKSALRRVLPARSYATQNDNDGKEPQRSFRGELYNSVARRLADKRDKERTFRHLNLTQRDAPHLTPEQIAYVNSIDFTEGLPDPNKIHFRDGEMLTKSESRRSLHLLLMAIGIAGTFYFVGSMGWDPVVPKISTLPLSHAPLPSHYTQMRFLEAAWADFKDIVGEENLSTHPAELERHSTSEWSSHPSEPGEFLPFVVVYPRTTEEVSKIMKICHWRRIPVTPFCGGTSLEGHFLPTRGGVCIDFQKMNKVLALHKDDLDIVVQPAVGWEELEEVLGPEGLFFPPDPGPGAQIGGMIATGCSGTNAARYGTMKEWVLSLTVVLADGTIVKTRQRPRKSSAGYDLTRLFIGSEGTLGLITEATLKLTPRPQHTSVAVCTFPNIRDAASLVSDVVKTGIQVAAVELLDDVQMKCINMAGHTNRTWKEMPTLFFKFAGSRVAVDEQIAQVKALAKKTSMKSFEFAHDIQEQKDLWSARKEALWSVMALRHSPDDTSLEAKNRVWTTDVAVPVSRLAEIIEETKNDITNAGILGSIVGHVGDGNFHAMLLFSEAERPKVEDVVHKMVKRAIEMEGTVTGEHGVGLVKRDYLREELGDEAVDLMRRIKVALDPYYLLNCDKVVRVSKSDPVRTGKYRTGVVSGYVPDREGKREGSLN